MLVTILLLFYYFLPVLIAGLACFITRKGSGLRNFAFVIFGITVAVLCGCLWTFWPPDEFAAVFLVLAFSVGLIASVILLVASIAQRFMPLRKSGGNR
jgi:uncharacterized membrane protein YeaQ/YmgE (transglycosylase-associated protein family)